MSARVAAPVVTKALVLSESSETAREFRCCMSRGATRGKAVGHLPDCLDGTHADENADGLSLRGSDKSYQGYHKTDDINGLGIVREQSQQGREHASK